jgi:hypothetical protein
MSSRTSPPDAWDLDKIWTDVLWCLDRIAATGCAMELNTSGVAKEVPEMNPAPRILRAMCERGIPVVIGVQTPDASLSKTLWLRHRVETADIPCASKPLMVRFDQGNHLLKEFTFLRRRKNCCISRPMMM